MGIDWEEWEATWRANGLIIDRPRGTAHPRYHDRIYPMDYGYIPNTTGGDEEEVDVFRGTSNSGLVGAILTNDAVKGDAEIKLLIDVSTEEIEIVCHFLQTMRMKPVLIRREM